MILDTILAKIAPYECLGCAAEGSLLCRPCGGQLARIPSRCYRCQRLSKEYRTCETCRAHSALFSVLPATPYQGVAKELVLRLKFAGAQRAAAYMADHMSSCLKQFDVGGLLIVPIPTATSRVRKRGYDQAVLLARVIARQSQVSYGHYICRLGQNEQLGANRQQRVTQLAHAYRCSNPNAVAGKHVILVDDVMTTGATLEAAAKAIKAAGAQRVSAVVFAQA